MSNSHIDWDSYKNNNDLLYEPTVEELLAINRSEMLRQILPMLNRLTELGVSSYKINKFRKVLLRDNTKSGFELIISLNIDLTSLVKVYYSIFSITNPLARRRRVEISKINPNNTTIIRDILFEISNLIFKFHLK